MNKSQALHRFFSSFAWPAYDENTVPTNAELPYIAYEMATDKIGSPVVLSASLYDRSTSWINVSSKADEIAEFLGYGGVTIPFDNGIIWVTQGSPFAQRMADDDDTIRRIILNFAVEFLSAA